MSDTGLVWNLVNTCNNSVNESQVSIVLNAMTHLKKVHRTCLFPRILTKLLEVSDDPQVLAVAAHDVGEYVRHYPRGKR